LALVKWVKVGKDSRWKTSILCCPVDLKHTTSPSSITLEDLHPVFLGLKRRPIIVLFWVSAEKSAFYSAVAPPPFRGKQKSPSSAMA
jgi:hypothetical protein